MFKPGQSGFAGRKHAKKANGNPGAGHTLRVLVKLRREPVSELIKLADESANVDYKTGIWKYLLERRDAGLELAGTLTLEDSKADLAALEKVDVPKVTNQAS